MIIMKAISNMIILLISYMGTVMAAESIPTLNQTRRIDLNTADRGWILMIRPDGSARLLFGSLMEDEARCPAGTFDFSDIYAFLVPKIKGKKSAGDVAVAISREGTFSTTSQYIDEFEAKPFFVKAQQTCTPIWDKDRFAMLLKEYPFESEFSLSKHSEPSASRPRALSQATLAPKPQPEVQTAGSTNVTITSATTTIAKTAAAEALTTATPWNIIIVLFLAAIGLSWWILKRRS